MRSDTPGICPDCGDTHYRTEACGNPMPNPTPPCIICEYDVNELLGHLGPLVWYKCRCCGMIYNPEDSPTPICRNPDSDMTP